MTPSPRTRLLALGALALCLFAGKPARAMAPSDAWITTRVKMSLLTAQGISAATHANVDTVDGRVTLHGVVPSEAEKSRAAQVAGSITGVTGVQNLLQVVRPELVETLRVADAQLEKRVAAVLARDEALQSSRVRVASVHAGVVLLAGSARTLSAHRRAIEDARAVAGVKRVSSEIQSPDRLGDDEIFMNARESATDRLTLAAHDTWLTTAVKARLLATADVPALDVNVDTEHSIVVLFGRVPSLEAKQRAEATAKQVDGVRGVKNDLQVVPAADAERVEDNDARISAAIDRRLESRSELTDGRISVQVENGVARLTGSVASQSDRLIAMTTARRVPGVRSVIDDLSVEN